MKTRQEALYAIADYAVRVIAADALLNAGLVNQANDLRNLPKIIDRETADAHYATSHTKQYAKYMRELIKTATT